MSHPETSLPPTPASPPHAEPTRALTATWLVLLSLSLANYFVAEGVLTGATLATAIFVAVFVKLGLVTSVFMELRSHGRAWLLPVLGLFALVIGVLRLVW